MVAVNVLAKLVCNIPVVGGYRTSWLHDECSIQYL